MNTYIYIYIHICVTRAKRTLIFDRIDISKFPLTSLTRIINAYITSFPSKLIYTELIQFSTTPGYQRIFRYAFANHLDLLFALKTVHHPFPMRSVTLGDVSETHLAIDNGTKVAVNGQTGFRNEGKNLHERVYNISQYVVRFFVLVNLARFYQWRT